MGSTDASWVADTLIGACMKIGCIKLAKHGTLDYIIRAEPVSPDDALGAV